MPTVRIPPRPASAPAASGGRTTTAADAAPRRRRKRVRGRRLAWAAAALLLAAVVVRSMRPAPLDVETATVERGSLRVTVDEDGVTRVRDRYVVAAPVSGRLLRMGLEEGDSVAAGEVIARIAAAPLDTRTADQARARVTAAEEAARGAGASLAELRAGLTQARRDAARLRTLQRAGAVSDHDAEVAETEAEARAGSVAAAAARLGAARAEARAARAALDGADADASATVVVVRAPVRGRVLRVAQESETPVAAGTPLVELGDAAGLEVLVDVLSADAVRIRPGMTLVVDEWGGAGVLPGTVRTVSPAAFTRVSALGVEEQRVNVTGDLAEPPEGLGAGYRVEARIVTWEGRDVVKVPNSALFRAGAGWAVYAVRGGRARVRPVSVGHRGDAEAEVLGGLRPGDVVVVYPSDKLREGVRVRAE